jgi:hypothetical protein
MIVGGHVEVDETQAEAAVEATEESGRAMASHPTTAR